MPQHNFSSVAECLMAKPTCSMAVWDCWHPQSVWGMALPRCPTHPELRH